MDITTEQIANALDTLREATGMPHTFNTVSVAYGTPPETIQALSDTGLHITIVG